MRRIESDYLIAYELFLREGKYSQASDMLTTLDIIQNERKRPLESRMEQKKENTAHEKPSDA